MLGGGDRKARILVVDDNPGDVELLRMALAEAGVNCDLTVLDNGREALEFVQGRGRFGAAPPPDLVILDLNLPRNDGTEILEAMRATESYAETPVAILSSSSSSREQAKVEGLRVKRFIVKPPDLDKYMRIGVILREVLAEERARGIAEV